MPYSDPAKQKEALRRWYRRVVRKRRTDWFKGKQCATCGSTRRLELDHVDPALKVDHKIWSWSEKRRTEELNKCVPRCRTCHIERSAEQQRKPLVHGTRDGYMWHRCRCRECVKAASLYRNEQRRLKGRKN